MKDRRADSLYDSSTAFYKGMGKLFKNNVETYALMFDTSVISLRTAKAFAKHFTCFQTKPRNTDDRILFSMVHQLLTCPS